MRVRNVLIAALVGAVTALGTVAVAAYALRSRLADMALDEMLGADGDGLFEMDDDGIDAPSDEDANGSLEETLGDLSGDEDDPGEAFQSAFQMAVENPEAIFEMLGESGLTSMPTPDIDSDDFEPNTDDFVGPNNPAPGTEKWHEMHGDDEDEGGDPFAE